MPVLTRTATIPESDSITPAIQIGGSALVGIVMPATWTAANITLQGSHDGVTFNNMYDSAGIEKTITAAAARYITLEPADFVGCDEIKIRSGTAAAHIDQDDARTITLVLVTM